MFDKLRQAFKLNYETLNRLEIKKAAILANYEALKKQQSEAAIFPVLKSNAYGHGLKELAQILNESDAPMVAVDSFPEAQIVKKYFKRDILILSRMPRKVYSYASSKRYQFCIADEEVLNVLPRGAKIHLFLNTGMNREGIKDLPGFLKKNKTKLAQLKILGLCSHLASADIICPENEAQLEKFLEALKILERAGQRPRWVHLGNSAGIFTLKNYKLSAFRSGLALYGYNPLSQDHPKFKEAAAILKPALELYSRVVAQQKVYPGEKVSYSGSYLVTAEENIAVIPFGYYEGLPRRLSGQAIFYCDKERLLVAGKICMNSSCLVTGVKSLPLGTEVQLISANSLQSNSLINLAAQAEMIEYEFLTGLKANIRRIIV
ncbi:alanine racemase [Candidatus Falkowbacteria bacterium]|nr:alanine racemase [Candidatus Falkowbacteria bacterium]